MRARFALLLVAGVVAISSLAVIAQQPPAGGQGAGGGRRGGGGAPTNQMQNPNGMHIYIRAGLKTHGEGQHDYPQFLADWSKILTDRGAVVDGSLHSPTASELEKTDVVVIYKGDVEFYMSDKDKADLEAFVKRGGGIVSFHDSLCAANPEYWANMFTGGSKKHGETNFSAGDLSYTIVDKADPIMQGMSDFVLNDESFMLMTWAQAPQIHSLATVKIPGGAHAGEVVPQVWTYEHTAPGGTAPSRAFVWMQGHAYKNFTDPRIEPMILRGIAWAGKKPVDTLMTVVARGGGRGPGGSDIVVPQGRGRGNDN
jgi:type 1 glutamine amidotransferase